MPKDDKIEADAKKDADRIGKDLKQVVASNEQSLAKLKKLMKQIEAEAKKK